MKAIEPKKKGYIISEEEYIRHKNRQKSKKECICITLLLKLGCFLITSVVGIIFFLAFLAISVQMKQQTCLIDMPKVFCKVSSHCAYYIKNTLDDDIFNLEHRQFYERGCIKRNGVIDRVFGSYGTYENYFEAKQTNSLEKVIKDNFGEQQIGQYLTIAVRLFQALDVLIFRDHEYEYDERKIIKNEKITFHQIMFFGTFAIIMIIWFISFLALLGSIAKYHRVSTNMIKVVCEFEY
ncbi:hypothetical protein FGO68_gene11056 [Halteria grandinella]|uniref:Uncharacterized protein n=1 Tax=Halteria grandinella TaxID=5974 RepID=A0A8J8NII0_HALGN|nr:hypothetical protein FGO68_gene11056 [Halteria grandinella]